MGMYLHFKTQETENDQLLDGGNLGNERKLYYRELIARFAHHLALNWNLGEENTNTTQQQKDFAEFIHNLDPYGHNIVIHTYPIDHEKVYRPLLGNNSLLIGISIQTGWDNVYNATKKWVTESANAGKKWIVANDEQNPANDGVKPDGTGNNHDAIRKGTLWGNIMAGGAGVEYYFGYRYPNSDLTCEDFRSRDNMWDYTRYALDFFTENTRFWEMSPQSSLVDNGWCLAKKGEEYVVYLKNGGSTQMDLSGADGEFCMKWYNPRTGQFAGNERVVNGGGHVSSGNPPVDLSQDWALLVTKNEMPVSISQNRTKPLASRFSQSASVHDLLGRVVENSGNDLNSVSGMYIISRGKNPIKFFMYR
jgi:hypothetical protein